MADISNSSSNKSHLKIMIMNTGGKAEGAKPTDRRKQAIYDVVTNTCPALALFQEFKWKGIRSPAWNDYSWSDDLQYTGHDDASILFDEKKVTVEELSQKVLEDTLHDLIRMGDIQQGFTPIPRMCLRKVKTKEEVPVLEFICISWHGRYNKLKLDELKEEFKSMLKYSLKLSEKKSLPVLLAGDFNLKIWDIEEKHVPPPFGFQRLVQPSLVMYKYKPTERRAPENIIDYFISSKSLVMSDINALALESKTNVIGVLSLFDHDPVVSFISTETETGNKDSNIPLPLFQHHWLSWVILIFIRECIYAQLYRSWLADGKVDLQISVRGQVNFIYWIKKFSDLKRFYFI